MLENAGLAEKRSAISHLLQLDYEPNFFRNLESSFFGNDTMTDDFMSNLSPARDVSVATFKASVVFNLFVFSVLMASYEILRRLFPSVYAARKERVRATKEGSAPDVLSHSNLAPAGSTEDVPENPVMPLTWIGPVFNVSWATVRKVAGLDGYFFLRYIRMYVCKLLYVYMQRVCMCVFVCVCVWVCVCELVCACVSFFDLSHVIE